MNEHLKALAEQAKHFAHLVRQLTMIDLDAPEADIQITAHIADCRNQLQVFEILFNEMEAVMDRGESE